MCKVFSFQTWLILSLIWCGVVSYFGFTSMPHVPLDMGGADAATDAAFKAAMLKHSLFFGALAAVPPLIALGFGRLLCGRT